MKSLLGDLSYLKLDEDRYIYYGQYFWSGQNRATGPWRFMGFDGNNMKIHYVQDWNYQIQIQSCNKDDDCSHWVVAKKYGEPNPFRST